MIGLFLKNQNHLIQNLICVIHNSFLNDDQKGMSSRKNRHDLTSEVGERQFCQVVSVSCIALFRFVAFLMIKP